MYQNIFKIFRTPADEFNPRISVAKTIIMAVQRKVAQNKKNCVVRYRSRTDQNGKRYLGCWAAR